MTASISARGLPGSAPDRAIPDFLVAFYRAYLSRDETLLQQILHDDVEWLLMGPADQLDIYGRRSGKAETIELITRIMPCYFEVLDFEFEHLLVDGPRIAAYGQARARQCETGRALRFRVAHFLRFENGKLMSYRSMADTFDVVEQLVGHQIDINKRVERVTLVLEEDELLIL